MASTDAYTIPIKNLALRITFPIFDADGDLVTGATGLDSEVSKDGAAFADCTNEATEIASSSGMYFLDLTSTEMNADTVAVIVKTSTSGAKTTPIVLYTSARTINNLAFPNTSGRGMDVDASGGVEVGSFQTGALTSAAFGAGAIDNAAIAADAIGSSELAASAATEIATAVLAATLTELAAVPGAGPSLADAIEFLYMALRNAGTDTASAATIKNNAGSTIATATLSDDGTTFTKAKYA
jgi:hypothetical protein